MSVSGSRNGASPTATPVSTGRGSLITSNRSAGPEQKIASAWAALGREVGPPEVVAHPLDVLAQVDLLVVAQLLAVAQAAVGLVEERAHLGAARLGTCELGGVEVEVETQDLRAVRAQMSEFAELAPIQLVRLHRLIVLLVA